jgi:DNA-binding MarR family transcriptional regulator
MSGHEDPLVQALPLLIADLFEAAGAVRRHGERLAGENGQTQARWQLLSVISEGEWTVPRAARRLGVTRQAVQRVADTLAADGLLTADPNPNHRRSPVLCPTPDGRRVLAAISADATHWHTRLAPELNADDLATTRRVLRTLITAAT